MNAQPVPCLAGPTGGLVTSHAVGEFHISGGGKRMNFLWFIVIGICAGWLAGQIMKGGGFGLVGDLVVGIIGALLGGLLFDMLGISAGGLLGALITATVGAIVLILLLRMIKRAP